jgi:Fe-S-cluster-containing dehydrogenase component
MKALLVDYKYCTGCHACEVACKKELDLEKGQFGIHVFQEGPWPLADGKWEYKYVPMTTSLCDMCANRVSVGKPPTCVHHCPARIIFYGEVDELVTLLAEKPGAILLTEK